MNNKAIFFLICWIAGLILLSCTHEPKTKVVCIGDSITEGAGVKNPALQSYPSVLANKLGNSFQLLNCGQGGATMLRQSDLPYWQTNEWYNAQVFDPDLAVIALGTNDSKDPNWDRDRFEQDYHDMICLLQKLNPEIRLLVCLPPPAFNHSWGINDSTILREIIPVIRKLADEFSLEVIDFNSPLTERQDLFPDGIHPNEQGAAELADFVADAIHH